MLRWPPATRVKPQYSTHWASGRPTNGQRPAGPARWKWLAAQNGPRAGRGRSTLGSSRRVKWPSAESCRPQALESWSQKVKPVWSSQSWGPPVALPELQLGPPLPAVGSASPTSQPATPFAVWPHLPGQVGLVICPHEGWQGTGLYHPYLVAAVVVPKGQSLGKERPAWPLTSLEMGFE